MKKNLLTILLALTMLATAGEKVLCQEPNKINQSKLNELKLNLQNSLTSGKITKIGLFYFTYYAQVDTPLQPDELLSYNDFNKQIPTDENNISSIVNALKQSKLIPDTDRKDYRIGVLFFNAEGYVEHNLFFSNRLDDEDENLYGIIDNQVFAIESNTLHDTFEVLIKKETQK